jgi:hypothetical protein
VVVAVLTETAATKNNSPADIVDTENCSFKEQFFCDEKGTQMIVTKQPFL